MNTTVNTLFRQQIFKRIIKEYDILMEGTAHQRVENFEESVDYELRN